MKRLSIVVIMAFSMLAMFAQEEAIRVDFTGKQPTIKDFLQAYVQSLPDINDLDECDVEGMQLLEDFRHAVLYQGEGIALEPSEKLQIDLKNGYVCYEQRHERELSRIEMCYWNESDGKHKLFACVRQSFDNGWYVAGQYDGMEFFRYNNATKTMKRISTEEIGVDAVSEESGNMGVLSSISLPRKGKDIEVTWWDKNGECGASPLKWNGHGFNF